MTPKSFLLSSEKILKNLLVGIERFELSRLLDITPSMLHVCRSAISPIMVGRVGVEPTVFLVWGIYSPLPSPLGIPTHNGVDLPLCNIFCFRMIQKIRTVFTHREIIIFTLLLSETRRISKNFFNLFIGKPDNLFS